MFVPRSWQDKKHLYLLNELKTYHFKYYMYRHDIIDIADPSSVQDVCPTELHNRPPSL